MKKDKSNNGENVNEKKNIYWNFTLIHLITRWI